MFYYLRLPVQVPVTHSLFVPIERLLAAQNPLAQTDRPHQLFADAPAPPTDGVTAPSGAAPTGPPPGAPPGAPPLSVPPPAPGMPAPPPPPGAFPPPGKIFVAFSFLCCYMAFTYRQKLRFTKYSCGFISSFIPF